MDFYSKIVILIFLIIQEQNIIKDCVLKEMENKIHILIIKG